MSPNDSVPRPGVKYLAHIVFSVLIFEKSPQIFLLCDLLVQRPSLSLPTSAPSLWRPPFSLLES